MECAALSALWPVAAWRDHDALQTCNGVTRSWSRLRRQAAAGQSADEAAHSKEEHSREAALLGLLCAFKAISYYQNNQRQGWGMANHFERVTETTAVDDLAESSKERPIVIFKHSLTCPISAAAYDQMEAFDGNVALVEVQRARELSNEIENRLGIEHASPQVIVLRNGQVVWNASHFKITADAVTEAVRRAGGTPDQQVQVGTGD